MSEEIVAEPIDVPEDTSNDVDLENPTENIQEPVEGEELSEESHEEIIETIKTLKLKVDGEEFEEELPFEISPEHAEYLTKQMQLAKMSQKRAQEAAELKKIDAQKDADLEGFLEALKGNTGEVLKKLGIDVKDFSEKILEEEIKNMELSEEEREIKRLQDELKEHQEREDAAKKQAELNKQERLRDQYAAEYEKDLMTAIDSSGLPNDPEIISRMTNYMRIALQNKIDLSFADIVPLVKDSINNNITSLMKTKNIEDLLQMLSEEQVKGIIGSSKPKKVVPPTASSIKDTATPKTKTSKEGRTVSMNDFFKNL